MINDQPVVDLNVTFNGKYYFLLWILKRFKTELPYCGQVKQFALMNNYSMKVCDAWRRYGVGHKVWNILHKDLVIISLIGKIPMTSLPQLEEDWNAWKKNDLVK